MRFIYSLVAIFIISSCGGGGSSTEIILNTEENSAEPCQNYVSSNGSGKTFNCSIIHDEKNRQFLFIREVHILEMLLFYLSFMAILVELYGL